MMTDPIQICLLLLQAHYQREIAKLKDIESNLNSIDRGELKDAWLRLTKQCNDEKKRITLFFQWIQARVDEGFLYLD